MATYVIIGSCTGHENPDLWFPEQPEHRPSIIKNVALATEINEALSICRTCPKIDDCYEEGMKPENISYGIWGGTMAGERLLSSGIQRRHFSASRAEAIAIDMFYRLLPWLER